MINMPLLDQAQRSTRIPIQPTFDPEHIQGVILQGTVLHER